VYSEAAERPAQAWEEAGPVGLPAADLCLAGELSEAGGEVGAEAFLLLACILILLRAISG